MTNDSTKLLNLVTRLAPVTRARLLMQCNDYERRKRRLVLAELLEAGLIERIHGWYVPAGRSGLVLTVSKVDFSTD